MFSIKRVLLKKFLVLNVLTHKLFQYILIPNLFKIGKLDWPIIVYYLLDFFFFKGKLNGLRVTPNSPDL